MKDIKEVVKKFNQLCKNNQFETAGRLARSNKGLFIQHIEKGTNKDLVYAYRVCHIFNMRQTDCFNLKF